MRRARQAGIKMICVGTQAATSESAIELSEKYPEDIWATAGFHPNHLSEKWHHDKKEQTDSVPKIFDIRRLADLASRPKVVAIGECGLDYYRLPASGDDRQRQIKKQQEIFQEQIQLAESLKKPLMMHTRPALGTDDAYEDALEILRGFNFSAAKINHFYVGSLAITKKLLDEGFYFTFGGVITFVRDYENVIKYIPLSHILLETDAPYVAPEPYRGKRNEPAYLLETAKRLAEIQGITYEKTAETTTKNAMEVFKLNA